LGHVKQSFRFQNPLRQNYKHLKALETALSLPEEVFHSVVVFFIGDSKFKTEMPEMWKRYDPESGQKGDECRTTDLGVFAIPAMQGGNQYRLTMKRLTFRNLSVPTKVSAICVEWWSLKESRLNRFSRI